MKLWLMLFGMLCLSQSQSMGEQGSHLGPVLGPVLRPGTNPARPVPQSETRAASNFYPTPIAFQFDQVNDRGKFQTWSFNPDKIDNGSNPLHADYRGLLNVNGDKRRISISMDSIWPASIRFSYQREGSNPCPGIATYQAGKGFVGSMNCGGTVLPVVIAREF